MRTEGAAAQPAQDSAEYERRLQSRRKTNFRGDVLRLVSGTSAAQIIGFLAAPVLTRIYAPEAFGLAAIFNSFTGVLCVLACLSYEQSIVLPEDDREAVNLLGASICISLLVASLILPMVWFGGPRILLWLNAPHLEPYLWIVPIVVLIQGMFVSSNYWIIRTKQFGRLSVSKVASQFTTTSTTLGTGLAGHATAGAMIVAGVAGQAIGAVVLGEKIWRENGKLIAKAIGWRGMLAGIRRYKKFAIYTPWSSLLNAASWQMPVMMLGLFFPPVIVGFYALGFRIIQMPMSLIGKAINQVFLQKASEEKANGRLALLVEDLFHRLLVITMLPSIILAAVGKDLFGLVFGADWLEAGVFVQLLSPWALVWFISSPLSSLYYILEKQKEELNIQVLIFLTRVLSIWIGGVTENPRLAVSLFAVSGILTYGYLIKILFGFVNLKAERIFRHFGSVFRKAIIYLVPIILAKWLEAGAIAVLAISALVLLAFSIRNKKILSI